MNRMYRAEYSRLIETTYQMDLHTVELLAQLAELHRCHLTVNPNPSPEQHKLLLIVELPKGVRAFGMREEHRYMLPGYHVVQMNELLTTWLHGQED